MSWEVARVANILLRKNFCAYWINLKSGVKKRPNEAGRRYLCHLTRRFSFMDIIDIRRKKDWAVLTLNRGKVNAINHTMVLSLRETLKALKQDDAVRGLILTGRTHYFSAGLDLVELSRYDRHQVASFWKDFLSMAHELVSFDKPVIAAISGHSPAGGTVIALTCDYRFMARGEKYVIGLNEVAVGIPVPDSIFHLYSSCLGDRVAHQSLLEGRLFNPQEARDVGLVDQIVDGDRLLKASEKKLNKLLEASDYVLRESKRSMRKSLLKKVTLPNQEEIDRRVAHWFSDEFQGAIKDFLSKIGK